MAALAFTTMGPEKGLRFLKEQKFENFNQIVVTIIPREAKNCVAHYSSQTKSASSSRLNWKRTVASTPSKLQKHWESARPKSSDTPTYGRTNSSRRRMMLCVLMSKSAHHTLGRIKPSVHRLSAACVPKPRSTVTTMSRSTTPRSHLRIRYNALRAPRGYLTSGGGVRGQYMVQPCARTAGEHSAFCHLDLALTISANYRKYGVISFVKSDDSKKMDKKESLKRKHDGGSGTATPVPVPAPKLPPCALCRRMEPKSSMARCKTCTFSAHAGCYGIASQDMEPDWECELCRNARMLDVNLVSH